MTRWVAVVLLLLATPAFGGGQPCSPRPIINEQLSSFPIHDLGGQFIYDGYRNALDARVLAAAAIIAGGGKSPCGLLASDPFDGPNITICSGPYTSWRDAIRKKSDELGSKYISQGITNLGQIAASQGWQNSNGEVNKMFSILFGNPNQAVYYSFSCCGDCNYNKDVAIEEIILTVLLGTCFQGDPGCPPITDCPYADTRRRYEVGVVDAVRVVGVALDGTCAAR